MIALCRESHERRPTVEGVNQEKTGKRDFVQRKCSDRRIFSDDTLSIKNYSTGHVNPLWGIIDDDFGASCRSRFVQNRPMSVGGRSGTRSRAVCENHHRRPIHRTAVSRYKTRHYLLMKSIGNGDGRRSAKTTRPFSQT